MIKIDLKNCIAGGQLSLTNAYIKAVAEKLLADFSPNALKTPMSTDVDGFIEYLGFGLRFELLSNNRSILGMTNYSADTVVFYDPVNHGIIKKPVEKNTVIIDTRMTEGANKIRYSFTAGHECGHIVFDNPEVRKMKEQSRLLAMEHDDYGAAAYRTGEALLGGKPKDEGLWIEHYADYFSSCLILPDKTVKMAAIDVLRKNRIYADCIFPHSTADEQFCVDVLAGSVATIFDTSKEAAMYKLCDLKIIRGGREILANMRNRYKK